MKLIDITGKRIKNKTPIFEKYLDNDELIDIDANINSITNPNNYDLVVAIKLNNPNKYLFQIPLNSKRLNYIGYIK